MNIEKINTIGVLGGMSAVATEEYYNLINKKVKHIKGGHTIAEMVIVSVNFGNIERFIRTNKWDEAAEYLVEKAKIIEASGAVCLFLATNTMHKVRNQIKAAISIPFVDIFETVSKEITKNGKKNIGILGTYPVMTDPFYTQAYLEYSSFIKTIFLRRN
jgi:aspartate racemase